MPSFRPISTKRQENNIQWVGGSNPEEVLGKIGFLAPDKRKRDERGSAEDIRYLTTMGSQVWTLKIRRPSEPTN